MADLAKKLYSYNYNQTSHITIIFLQLYDNQYEVKNIEIITET